MSIRKLYFLIFLFYFTLASCSKPDKKIKITGHTMGTSYHIVVIGVDRNSPKINSEELKQQIDSLLLVINQQMSTYQKDSEITVFNTYKRTDWFSVSKDFAFVVNSAQEISQLTQGAFDITVSPFVDLWGFGKKTKYTIPTDDQLRIVSSYTGYQYLAVKKIPPSLKKIQTKVTIDLSAIAKGFAVDKVSAYLSKQGIENYLIEIGGEIKVRGKNEEGESWKIAIEQPNGVVEKASKIISLNNKGLATSGDYRNYYIKDGERFSHMINPKTGRPIKHKLASVTVINESTMIADAYATALMVMGEKDARAFIIKNKLQANMIIRKENGFVSWSNLLPVNKK